MAEEQNDVNQETDRESMGFPEGQRKHPCTVGDTAVDETLLRPLRSARRIYRESGNRRNFGLAVFLVTIIPILYVVLLTLIGFTVLILLLYTKPELQDGMPSLRKFFAWAAPLFGGTILFYYLLKSFLAKPEEPSHDHDEVILGRDAFPLIWTLVEEIGRIIDSPIPQRIFLDAGAGVKLHVPEKARTLDDVSEADMSIGISFVSGATIPQLAAAIGCELGRYRNDPSTNAVMTIRGIIRRLGFIIAYRDPLDKTIEELCMSEIKLMRGFGYFFRWMVRLVRGLMESLLTLAVLFGRGLVVRHQLECDAAAAAFARPAEFRSMLRKSGSLRGAVRLADYNLSKCMRQSLPDNYPGFVAETEKRLSDDMRRTFQYEVQDVESRLSPTITARAEHVASQGRAPLLETFASATTLLPEYDRLVRETTLNHYDALFGRAQARVLWVRPSHQFYDEVGYKAFGTEVGEQEIDYHAGDRWHKWIQRASTVGSLVMTIGLLGHTAVQVAKVLEPDESRYRRYIGKVIVLPEGEIRTITDVRYLERGEVAGQRQDTEAFSRSSLQSAANFPAALSGSGSDAPRVLTVKAPSTGWFYDTGDGYIVRCDERTDESYFFDFPPPDKDEEEARQLLDEAF